MAKAVKSKGSKSALSKKKLIKKIKPVALGAKAKPSKVIAVAKVQKPLASVAAQGASKASHLAPPPLKAGAKAEKKALSQKLIETIEKRKQGKEAVPHQGSKFFVKPPGRRGRRPKNLVDYTPTNQEEDSYVLESEQESLTYDTGISVAAHRDDAGGGLERIEDFDEELNFDW